MATLKRFLQVASKNKPFFLKESWVLGVPHRHIFMSATVGAVLARRRPEDRQQPIHILEIGTWMGASLLTWTEAVQRLNGGHGRIVGIDPLVPYFDAEETKQHLEKSIHAQAQTAVVDEAAAFLDADIVVDLLEHNIACVPAPTVVEFIRAPAREAMPKLAPASFDIVYIDGSHFYADVKEDIANARRVLKDGGILCGDDLELQAGQVDLAFAREKAGVDFVIDPKSGAQYHPGVTLAVSESLGQVAAYSGFWAAWLANLTPTPVDLRSGPFFIPSHFPVSTVEELKRQMAAAGLTPA